MHLVLVSHFHWDREWYRTFEAYRGRLVDAVDRVLDLLATDPGYRFLLDGQAVLIEDYLAVRPGRRDELVRGLRAGRLAAGPWYVQPDALLPSGEAHVRNLLHGRAACAALGAPASRVGYLPDSFGHPAQLPQLLAGFGITSFVHWRGNGDEIDDLGTTWRWEAPDGSAVAATLLREGYFNAAGLPADVEEAARHLAAAARRLAEADGAGDAAGDGTVIFMNGSDHGLPDAHTAAVAEALARLTGGTVVRGLLEDALAGRHTHGTHRGELTGARLANLLPGVWSARMPIKLRNRRCEALLAGWAEPWTALGRARGLPDERPALGAAWRTLLCNQAHDSIGGCALDAVAARVMARFDDTEGLAAATIARVLERLAGQGPERCAPWTLEQEIAVFNPSPHPRTDLVRVALDAYPSMRMTAGLPEFPPLLLASSEAPGFTIEGQPARVVPGADPDRTRWLPGQEPCDVEFVAADVPAFGCRRYRLVPSARVADEVDDGRTIEVEGVRVTAEDGGTLTMRLRDAEYRGLLGVEDRGDRGDTYDFDPVAADPGATLVSVAWRRRRHPSGIACLEVTRTFRVPRALDAAREARGRETADLVVCVVARVAPGVGHVDLAVGADNTAADHRLRLLFPTGRPAASFVAAATFDAAVRSTVPPDDARWIHPAPPTFAHQGWVAANGLMVVAPGLPEAEVTADGTIAITLLRAVGWLARYDLHSRPVPAGPAMATPGAQVAGAIEARLALRAGVDAAAARAIELGLRGVLAGPVPVLAPGVPLLEVEPAGVVLSALKPAEDGDGLVVRLFNPGDVEVEAVLRAGVPLAAVAAVRLDEEPADRAAALDPATGRVRLAVPPRALRSVRLRWQ